MSWTVWCPCRWNETCKWSMRMKYRMLTGLELIVTSMVSPRTCHQQRVIILFWKTKMRNQNLSRIGWKWRAFVQLWLTRVWSMEQYKLRLMIPTWMVAKMSFWMEGSALMKANPILRQMNYSNVKQCHRWSRILCAPLYFWMKSSNLEVAPIMIYTCCTTYATQNFCLT